MRLSWSLPRCDPYTASRSEWLTAIEAQAATADMLGFDTLWLSAPELDGMTVQQLLRAVWRLSSVTSQVQLGIVLGVDAEAGLTLLSDELKLLSAVAGARIRVALTLHRSLAARADLGQLPPVQPVAVQLQKLAVALGVGTDVRDCARRSQPDAVARRVSVVAGSRAEAAEAGALGLGLTLDAGAPHEWIAAYRQADAGCVGHLTLTRAVIAEPTVGGSRQAGTLRPGSAAQIAAGLIVQQLATGCDEMTVAAAECRDGSAGALHALELLGREVLPRVQEPSRARGWRQRRRPTSAPMRLLDRRAADADRWS